MTEKITSVDHVEIEALTVEDESNKTARQMESLLAIYEDDSVVEYNGLNLNALEITTEVSYNAESQRFEAKFSEKPPESVRKTLKAMKFGWNRWEYCWELYAWQVRLFDSVELAYFLEGLKRGMVIKPLDAPEESKRPWWKDLDKKGKSLIEELAEAVQAERDSEAFGELLKASTLFHTYSRNNCFLIMVTCPHAQLVTGEKKWNKMGRYVKWGEKPIMILGPRFKTFKEKNPRTGKIEKVKKMAGFLGLPVYDISQTDGAPLPTINYPDMSGDDGKVFFEAMKEFCEEKEIKVTFRDLSDIGAVGESSGGEITLTDRERSINEQCSTISHEVAHEYLHKEKMRLTPQSVKETEAEGVAFVVLKALGLKTKAPVYIATQGGTAKTVMDCANNISKVAHVIVSYMIQRTGWNLDPLGRDEE